MSKAWLAGFRRAGLCALWAAAFVCGAAWAQDNEDEFMDEIERRLGPVASEVKIIQDTWKGVRYQINVNARQKPEVGVPITDIAKIIYGENVWKYWERNAARATRRGLTEASKDRAIRFFEKRLREDAPKMKWMGQYVLYYLGVTYMTRNKGDGDAEKARQYFDKLLSQYKDTRFKFDANLEIGESYFNQGKFDEAVDQYAKCKKLFSRMANDPQIANTVRDHCKRKRLTADFLTGKVYEEGKKDFTRALSVYRRVESGAERFPDIKAKAQARIGSTLIRGHKYPEAIAYFRRMTVDAEKTGDESALGSAYVGLGSCYYFQKDYVRARFNFLRVIVLYFQDDANLAEAHYWASRCYEQLAAKEKGAEASAKRHLKILAERHPRSRWGKEAVDRLRGDAN